jgi:2'-5' RNA ligase
VVTEPERRQQAVVFLVGPSRQRVEALRRRWDPDNASRIGAHVTIAYDDEAPDSALLAERLASVASRTAPFWLRLGGVERFVHEDVTIYVDLTAVRETLEALRGEILQPPFRPRPYYTPHVTLVLRAGPELARVAWEGLKDERIDATSAADRLTTIEQRGGVWLPVADFALSGGPALARPELAWPPVSNEARR